MRDVRDVRDVRDIQDVQDVQDVWKHFIPTSLSSDTFNPQWLGVAAQKRFQSPLTASTHNGLAAQKRFRSPLTVSTHDGLTYDRANSSALRATTSRDAHSEPRLFVVRTDKDFSFLYKSYPLFAQ